MVNVPNAPGVPIMSFAKVADVITTVASDAKGVLNALFGQQLWGIFDANGNPILIGDSVVAVDFRREYRLSDYPVEDGGFATYDKVQMPFDVRVTFAVSGKGSLLSTLLSGGALGAIISGNDPDLANRTAFLTAMEAQAQSLALLSVHTPEMSYPSCNITHYDYRREVKKGATLITVEVWLSEVRVIATAQFSNSTTNTGTSTGATQNPASVDPQANGTTQAAAPSVAQAASAPATPAVAAFAPSSVEFT